LQTVLVAGFDKNAGLWIGILLERELNIAILSTWEQRPYQGDVNPIDTVAGVEARESESNTTKALPKVCHMLLRQPGLA
jgi:hypothetical protein